MVSLIFSTENVWSCPWLIDESVMGLADRVMIIIKTILKNKVILAN